LYTVKLAGLRPGLLVDFHIKPAAFRRRTSGRPNSRLLGFTHDR